MGQVSMDEGVEQGQQSLHRIGFFGNLKHKVRGSQVCSSGGAVVQLRELLCNLVIGEVDSPLPLEERECPSDPLSWGWGPSKLRELQDHGTGLPSSLFSSNSIRDVTLSTRHDYDISSRGLLVQLWRT